VGGKIKEEVVEVHRSQSASKEQHAAAAAAEAAALTLVTMASYDTYLGQ
jgi:hypothetical protein